ncbi:MAG: V-type ATP synthase subunit A [bacterium]
MTRADEAARLVRVAGPLAEAEPMRGAALYELVRVGARGLLGEVVRIHEATATLQVYEDTSGLATGEPVEGTGQTLAAQLGPGLLGSILDGVGRPLPVLAATMGAFIEPGARAATLDGAARFSFLPLAAAGASVRGGDVLGTVIERGGFEHRVLVPPRTSGVIADLAAGSYTVHEAIGHLADGTPLALAHGWPVREPRPVARRLPGDRPLVTRQRVFDLFFPVAEGGSVAVPGGFGTGKTVIEHSLAKHADADVVVYVGCGERGNEMSEVLQEFPKLVDPTTQRSILDRTVMVVNTSNMPVAAREASVYLGMTIAEYYRDQGYRVLMLADSLSRWAEALREIGARLAEMPGEEGYPTYLGNRIGQFYERAGRVEACGGAQPRTGSVTLIAAVSPPGGDLAEPVTQATLRVAGALWALDPALAHQRQFPAVDWETSYSAYAERLGPWFAARGAAQWSELRRELLALLGRGREVLDIAGLVGPDALQDQDRLLLETARLARDVVLGQSAFDPHDAASPPAKTSRLAELVVRAHRVAAERIQGGVRFDALELGPLRRMLAAIRLAPLAEIEERAARAAAAIDALGAGAAAPPAQAAAQAAP